MGSRERVSRVDDENSHYLSVRYLLLASIEQPLSLEVCETGMLPICGWDGKDQSTKNLYTLKRVLSKQLTPSLVVYPYDRKTPHLNTHPNK